MKTMYAYTKMILMATVAILTLTGCDNDAALAYDLDGVWQGTIYGDYYSYRRGSNDYDTEIMFHQYGAWGSGGNGYEIDRNRRTGRYTKNYFEWSVRNGRIHIAYDDGYHIVIRDFDTYWRGGLMRFRGYFDDYDTGEQLASFDLVKVESSSDYYDYYYTRQGAEEEVVEADTQTNTQ